MGRIAAFMALVAFLTVALAPAADLRTLTGNKTGELWSIDAKEVVFKTADGMVSTKLDQVLQVDFQQQPPAAVPHHLVELTDGTLLRIKTEGGFTVKGKQVELIALLDVKVQVPLTALSYVLKDAHDPKVRDHPDWKVILKSRKSQDMLVTKGEDRFNGIGGTFGDGNGTVLEFTTEGGLKVPADLSANKKIQGFVFVNKPEAGTPVPVCKLHDIHHNLLMPTAVEAKEGGDLAVTLAGRTQVVYKTAALVKLDYSKGKLTFLSDLDPKVVREPDDERFGGKYRRDKNLDDSGKIQIGGQKYDKGLALLAPTVLSYQIGGEYREFNAWVGVDDMVSGNSHVRLVIEGDGKEIFSAEVKRKDPRREVKLNIKDIQELRIRVESVPLIFYGHHLNLADAKISK